MAWFATAALYWTTLVDPEPSWWSFPTPMQTLPSFDVRTVAFMFGLINCILAVMLFLTGWHLKTIRGIQKYAVGDLCIGLAASLTSYFAVDSDDPRIALEVLGFAFGHSLRLNGIRGFKGERSSLWFPVGMGLLAGFNTYWWVAVDAHIRWRVTVNSLIYATVSLLCAKALWIRAEPLIQKAYRFTGTVFALCALAMAARAAMAWAPSLPVIDHHHSDPYSIGGMLLISILQFFSAFGFVLMLNYRLATDLDRLASRDHLTGALNRRSLESFADRLCLQLSLAGKPLSILMLDIDHFKSINDRYGHLVGDRVLEKAAGFIRDSIRTDDFLVRYGGEEFCVLMPGITEHEARQIAERLRRRFAGTPVLAHEGGVVRCTVSIGYGDSLHLGLDLLALLDAADTALYRAKQSGRNRIVAASEMSANMPMSEPGRRATG